MFQFTFLLGIICKFASRAQDHQLLVWFMFFGHRPYWRCYFPNTQAIIYVVDSSDTDRLVIAKDEFHAILQVLN